ncbi:MAG: hypothetical protein GX354_12135 [Firmicutes bacterium]|jgi:hypothetical protein|nr:hypothetical protein [Bacillota bacterium]
MLTPLEVKKGMDSIASKDTYGDRLAFDGGLNAFYYEEPEKKWAEMRRIIPMTKPIPQKAPDSRRQIVINPAVTPWGAGTCKISRGDIAGQCLQGLTL